MIWIWNNSWSQQLKEYVYRQIRIFSYELLIAECKVVHQSVSMSDFSKELSKRRIGKSKLSLPVWNEINLIIIRACLLLCVSIDLKSMFQRSLTRCKIIYPQKPIFSVLPLHFGNKITQIYDYPPSSGATQTKYKITNSASIQAWLFRSTKENRILIFLKQFRFQITKPPGD